MTKVSSTAELPVSAKTVWAVIGNFNALPDWHPAVEKSEMKKRDGGTLRKLSLVGGGTIEEKLEKIDDKERRYTYSIVSGPLPVTNYTRSEEHTSELQSLMRISYAVFCLKKKKPITTQPYNSPTHTK